MQLPNEEKMLAVVVKLKFYEFGLCKDKVVI